MNKLLICMAVACVTAFNAAAQSFSAATYNIRQLNAKDTAEGNGWERRLPVISSLIRFHDFDIFGAQEVFHSQLQGMLAALPGYDYVGVGRDDGAAGGEYSAIFYKRGRFRLLDSGHFWLSEDPSKPGKGWDAKYVRICTWGRFYDRQSRQRFWFFTTHTDHRGEQAQAESCRLILAKIEELCRGERVILTGDFNVGETSRSYAILRDSASLADPVPASTRWMRADPLTALPAAPALFSLSGVVEGHSAVSAASSRAVFLEDLPVPRSPETSLAPATERLEPVHLHGVLDTSLHLCLPAARALEVCGLGWGEPHRYSDHDTEIMVYGPRDRDELFTVIEIVRESLAFARG